MIIVSGFHARVADCFGGQGLFSISKMPRSIVQIKTVLVRNIVGGAFVSAACYIEVVVAVVVGIKEQKPHVFGFFFQSIGFGKQIGRNKTRFVLQKENALSLPRPAHKNIVQAVAVYVAHGHPWRILRELMRQQFLHVEINKFVFLVNKVEFQGVAYFEI